MFNLFESNERVDDFGRVSIPKELRDKLQIHSGDIITWNVEGEELRLSKIIDLKQFQSQARTSVDVLSNAFKLPVAICDSDKVVASSSKYLDMRIRKELTACDDFYDSCATKRYVKPFVESAVKARFVQPINVDGCIIGYILVLENSALPKSPREIASASTIDDKRIELAVKLLTQCAARIADSVKGPTA